MSVRSIRRQATNPSAQVGTVNQSPIYVDSDDNILKLIPASSGTTEVQVLDDTHTFTTGLIRSGYTFQVGGPAKVGATAGWVLAAADNLPYLATQAASQTGGTLVVRITGLHLGDTITGFRVIAQVESAGGTVTIDGDLRAVTNVAAEPTDASIATMTQVSVTADTAVSQAKTGLTSVVTTGLSYYILITATTGASTDIILQYPEITVTTS